MSFRSHAPLALLLVPFVPALASAQSQAPAGQAPAAPTQARYAGTFHAAVGQWTRPNASAARGVGPDIIYVNTAPSGYFSTIGSPSGFGAGGTILDEGGLPGTTNGTPFAGMPDRDSYLVNSFQLGYCDLGPAGGSAWEISFYDAYVPATSDRTPEATVNVSGLPAGGGCWIIDIDLTGGMEFCLGAAGGEAELLVDEGDAAGVTGLLVKDGKVVQYDEFGIMRAETDAPIRADTIHRIYSMTKPITGMAIMMLIDEGKLGLDMPVSEVLPKFKDMQVLVDPEGPLENTVPAEREITIRHGIQRI